MIIKHSISSYKDFISAIICACNTNRLDIAGNLCIEASFKYPDSFGVNSYLAIIALKNNESKNAMHYANKAAQCYNSNKLTDIDIPLINDLGAVFFNLKQYKQANECFSEYIKFRPDDSTGLYNIGQIFFIQKDYLSALEYFQKAEKISSTYVIVSKIGDTYHILKQLDKAEEYFISASKIRPDEWSPYHCIGVVKQLCGKEAEAIHYLNKALEINPENAKTYQILSEITSFTKHPKNRKDTIKKIEALLTKPDLEKPDAIALNYALGHLYNKDKKYSKAFIYYEKGNLLKIESATFNIAKYHSGVERFTRVFNKEQIAGLKPFGNKSTIPALIVGMPRSGTTLAEQIIISHSNVYSLGETQNLCNLTAEIEIIDILTGNGVEKVFYPETIMHCSGEYIKQLSNRYLDIIGKNKKNALRIFDKMPVNTFNVGLMKLLFPNATIINCKRHPLDVIISMFTNNFEEEELPNGLKTIEEYYRCYKSIMLHWHDIFPGQIYDNYYEELVCRQPEKSRELINACGLDWEDACLDFYKNNHPVFTASHSQVKEPIYSSSVFRWKNYAKHLTEVKEILKDEIAEYEAEIIRRVPELALLLPGS